MTVLKLEGKRVLLISNNGYAKQMQDEVRALGGIIDYFNDKPNDKFFAKFLGRIKFKPYIKYCLARYYDRELRKLERNVYDFILVIRGEYTPIAALKEMNELFPNAKKILYMWDSIKNNKRIEKKWDFYDVVWTFDRYDYLENKERLRFFPLFYCEKELPKNVDSMGKKYDLAFIGTGHGDRISIIKEIKRQCETAGLSFYYYIYIPHILVYFYNKIFNKYFKKVSLSDVNFKSLPLNETYNIYGQADCILDIEAVTQTGLTMRTMEVFGLKKKLMTTNKDIINYDFYEPKNILIFDRQTVKLDESFLRQKYEFLSENIYQKYSLKNWLINILCE